MNGREIFLRRAESQHWPGSCCNNWRNKVNALGGNTRHEKMFSSRFISTGLAQFDGEIGISLVPLQKEIQNSNDLLCGL